MLPMYAIFATVAVFFIFLRFSIWRKKYCQRLPGKPPSFFNVFGDAAEFLFSKEIHIDVMNTIRKRIELFKKDKLTYIWITYVPFVLLVKSAAVKDLLKGNKMNEKSWVYRWMEPAFGKGLVTSLLFNLIYLFSSFSETMFGSTISALRNGSSLFKKSIERGEDIFISRLYKPWLWPSFIFWNSKYGKELKQHINLLEQVTDKIVQEKKEKRLRGESETLSGKYKALMDLLLEKHFETQELSEEDIKEEVKTFILAGHETVATSISWALYLIGLHPDVQAKIHEEIDQEFGEDVKRPITEMDLSGMQYLDCVLKTWKRFLRLTRCELRIVRLSIVCGDSNFHV
ncbi:Cytochrome P450 4V2 [Araneus ventricosus]|uniref:Cytochrome P450 4V2 n=1 Tax=Araneus ventricosus TaxID=182803 RepID=A0A4Y2LKC3_ARAVE|nr:Cytochrome P450 4V2 [Araneus ventricosus]